jgi:hypothetical protein
MVVLIEMHVRSVIPGKERVKKIGIEVRMQKMPIVFPRAFSPRTSSVGKAGTHGSVASNFSSDRTAH